MLERKVDYLNQITDSPPAPYTKVVDDSKMIKTRYQANPGNYHLSGAYGGWCLQRMHNEGGGVSTPLHTGYCPKRELFNAISAYVTGIEAGQS
jgi:hypothetical protein